jgi:hypothetical protein
MSAHRVIESLARTAALGVRFSDIASATSLIDGLRVEVFPHASPHRRVVAHPNRSGVYVAHAVPGLRDFEYGDAEQDALWASALRRYRVEVRDPHGRFLPIAFDADLPARGLFTWRAPWLSPPEPVSDPLHTESPPRLLVGRVPLFPAPTRPVPDPLAVVRAHLRDRATGLDIAWGLLGVTIDGQIRGLGLADAQGRVAVMFPYPEPPRGTLASPPQERHDFTWRVELTAFVPPLESPATSARELADLADILAAMNAPRNVVESLDSPAMPFRLTYRTELTARTAGTTAADASSLFVSP